MLLVLRDLFTQFRRDSLATTRPGDTKNNAKRSCAKSREKNGRSHREGGIVNEESLRDRVSIGWNPHRSADRERQTKNNKIAIRKQYSVGRIRMRGRYDESLNRWNSSGE